MKGLVPVVNVEHVAELIQTEDACALIEMGARNHVEPVWFYAALFKLVGELEQIAVYPDALHE